MRTRISVRGSATGTTTQAKPTPLFSRLPARRLPGCPDRRFAHALGYPFPCQPLNPASG